MHDKLIISLLNRILNSKNIENTISLGDYAE